MLLVWIGLLHNQHLTARSKGERVDSARVVAGEFGDVLDGGTALGALDGLHVVLHDANGESRSASLVHDPLIYPHWCMIPQYALLYSHDALFAHAPFSVSADC